MRKKYYICISPGLTGIHLMHSEECPFLPQESKRIHLGKFISKADAAETGKEYFDKTCLCPFCSKENGKTISRAAEKLLNGPMEAVTFKNLTPVWESALICGVN